MLMYSLANLLGEALLACIGREQCATWFPWNDVQCEVDRTGRGFILFCASLARHVTKDGHLCYSSPHKHTVTIRGKTRIVAFAPHAIQRIGERTVLSATSYAGLGDIFAYLHHCKYFEPARLHPDHDAFGFFAMCGARHFTQEYALQILQNLAPGTPYAYRVGYCPVITNGDFFVAKTLLVPGHVGTPEYGVLLKASFDKGVKEAMLARCHQHSYQMTCATKDFSLLRWFHTHGVPQVIPCPTPFFDYWVDNP